MSSQPSGAGVDIETSWEALTNIPQILTDVRAGVYGMKALISTPRAAVSTGSPAASMAIVALGAEITVFLARTVEAILEDAEGIEQVIENYRRIDAEVEQAANTCQNVFGHVASPGVPNLDSPAGGPGAPGSTAPPTTAPPTTAPPTSTPPWTAPPTSTPPWTTPPWATPPFVPEPSVAPSWPTVPPGPPTPIPGGEGGDTQLTPQVASEAYINTAADRITDSTPDSLSDARAWLGDAADTSTAWVEGTAASLGAGSPVAGVDPSGASIPGGAPLPDGVASEISSVTNRFESFVNEALADFGGVACIATDEIEEIA